MNSSRIFLFAFCLLFLSGALYLATGTGETFQVFSGSDALGEAFPVEDMEPLSNARPTTPLTERSTSVDVDTPYGAWLGTELVHQVRFESVVEITAGETTQIIRHILSGQQLVRIVDRTDEGFVAAYLWPNLEVQLIEDGVRAPKEGTQELREELGRPVLVYHDNKEDPRGTQQALRFTPGLSTTSRNWARTLVASQRAPVSETHPEGVDLVEADAAGRYRVHYVIGEHTKDSAQVQRAKLEALDGIAWGSIAEAPRVSGSGTVSLSRGWVEDVEWQEHSVMEVEEANLRITQSFTAEAERSSIGMFDGDGLGGWTLEEDWRSFDGHTEEEEALADASEALDVDLLADADADTLVSRLITLELANDHGAEALLAAERLALLVAEDPSILESLRRELSSGRLPEGTTAKILGSIATAGTPEAQEALRELFMLPNPPSGLRESTALALFQLGNVTPETVATFRGVLSDEEAGRDIRSTSWLLLGAFASTDSDPELATHLVAMESAALEADELISWLEALGNTRNPSVYEAAKRHLGAEDANARLSAVRALRHLNTPEVTQALIGPASLDRDATVRAEALTLLAGRAHEGALAVVGELLSEEPETSVRRAALEALVGRPMDSEVHQLLSAVASTDPDGSLRAYALTLLGS